MKIFYFTATGNSLYVAKRLGGELYAIPQMMKEGTHEFEDEAIGFVFPCYGFGVPRLVSDFIKKSTFKADYFFSIMTYGNIAASGLRHIENIGSGAGIQFNYTDEILMIDNYLPIYKIEDQLKQEDAKKIDETLDRIIRNVANREDKLIRKGIALDISSQCVRSLVAKFARDGSDKGFVVQDSCNRCGVCEKVCPVNNIKMGKKPEFLHRCEMCLACIHNCPQNAIDLKSQKSKVRFINQHVSLKEIIDANNQCD